MEHDCSKIIEIQNNMLLRNIFKRNVVFFMESVF